MESIQNRSTLAMRSLNTQDIQGAQPKRVNNSKSRYHGQSSISSINLATGEQIMQNSSIHTSPLRELNRVTSSPSKQPIASKVKTGYFQQDSIKDLIGIDYSKDSQRKFQSDHIAQVNYIPTQMQKQEISSAIPTSFFNLKTNHHQPDGASRMKSDPDFHPTFSNRDHIRLKEQLAEPKVDSTISRNSQFDNGPAFASATGMSVSSSKSRIIKNDIEQRNSNFSHQSFANNASSFIRQDELKNGSDYSQIKSQLSQKPNQTSSSVNQININYNEQYQDQSNNVEEFPKSGGGFYGDSSPIEKPKPVEMPLFDEKDQQIESGSQKKSGQQFSLKNDTISAVSPMRVIEPKGKQSIHPPWQTTQKEQRIIVICDSSNITRDQVNRFLGMRNVTSYEVFSLPGGPGCFAGSDLAQRVSWQTVFKYFLANVEKVYQIQEIQLFQNQVSPFSHLLEEVNVPSNQLKLMQNIMSITKQAHAFVKSVTNLPVKGYSLNQKGIIEKLI